MITGLRRQEIVAVFQASFKRDCEDAIAAIPVAELISTDEMLGARDLNSGYRMRLRNEIANRQSEAALKRSARSRWLDRAISFFVGAIVTALGVFLSHMLS